MTTETAAIHEPLSSVSLEILPLSTSASRVPKVVIKHAHPTSSDHRPHVEAAVQYDANCLVVSFDVWDRFVVARHLKDQAPVCLDSCVEFFVRPAGCRGYFNFEFNCIGTILAQFHSADSPGAPLSLPTRDEGGVDAQSSLTGLIDEEIVFPVQWSLRATIPMSLFETFGRVVRPQPKTVWHGNLYKCADRSSHPHWLAWSDIGTRLSFHQPERFGQMVFG